VPAHPVPSLHHTHIQLLFREERDRGNKKRQESEKRAPLCKWCLLCANELKQLPMPATWWSTRRWPSTPPAMHLAPNCLHSLTHARSTHHKRHQKAFTHTTTADRWRARLRERTRAKEEGVDVRATVRGFRPPRATQSQLRFPEEFLDHLVPWEVLPGGFVVVG